LIVNVVLKPVYTASAVAWPWPDRPVGIACGNLRSGAVRDALEQGKASLEIAASNMES
jgi:hypothetical protein